MTTTSRNPALIEAISAVFALLQRVQPDEGSTSVAWAGPWYVLPRRRWYPTWFSVYRGQLYATLSLSSRTSYELRWTIGSDEVELPPVEGWYLPWENTEDLWLDVLAQARRRLEWGLANPARYNRHMERYVPPTARRGHVLRRYTWPKGMDTALPPEELDQLERAVGRSETHPRRPTLSRARYLADAGVAYDAAFEDLRGLTPLEKYQRRADSRHGGFLDLAEDDAEGFRIWFTSRSWMGAHPWEIVYGHPHGIHLYPELDPKDGSWGYRFSVTEQGLREAAVKMAVALDAAGVPFTFTNGRSVLAALRGEDEVDVGTGYNAVRVEELLKTRPDALEHVRWAPLPPLRPITPEQAERIKASLALEANGSGRAP